MGNSYVFVVSALIASSSDVDCLVSLYFNALGGKHYFVFWALFLAGHLISDLIHSVHTYWLGVWAQAYETQDAADVNIAWCGFLLSCIDRSLNLSI